MRFIGVRGGRSARGALLLVLAALAPEARAGGEDGEAESRRRAAATAAGARISAFGNWCRGRSYKALAREQYEEALHLDPEDAAARAGLGHRKEESGWKAPEGRSPLLDAPTTSASSAALLEKEGTAAWAAAAEDIAACARWCAESGRRVDARIAWEAVLRLDPGHSGARAALGLERAEAEWTRSSEEGPAAAGSRFLKASQEGLRWFKEARASGQRKVVWESGTGWTESAEARFSVRSMAPVLNSSVLLEDMVQTEALWAGLGVLKQRRGNETPFRIVAAGKKEDYVALVDAVPGKDESWKAPHRKTGGCWPSWWLHYIWSGDAEWLRDTTVHDTTHHLLGDIAAGEPPPWISEGSGILASTLLRGKATMTCCALDESAVAQAELAALDWNGEARKLVQQGEDPPMGVLMAAGTNDLGLPFLLKARSMVAWMVARSPAAFRRVLEESCNGASSEDAIRMAFGAPSDAIERRWKYWVRRP